jgi:hypothetical protein
MAVFQGKPASIIMLRLAAEKQQGRLALHRPFTGARKTRQGLAPTYEEKAVDELSQLRKWG